MKHTFSPSVSSLFASFTWDVSPAATVGLCWLFFEQRFVEKGVGWLFLLVSGAMILWSVLLVVQSIFVHTKRVTVDEQGITVDGLGGSGMRFDRVANAFLRERVNFLSRTDRLVVLQSMTGGLLSFNPSTLSKKDEQSLLQLLRSHIDIQVTRDAPTI